MEELVNTVAERVDNEIESLLNHWAYNNKVTPDDIDVKMQTYPVGTIGMFLLINVKLKEKQEFDAIGSVFIVDNNNGRTEVHVSGYKDDESTEQIH